MNDDLSPLTFDVSALVLIVFLSTLLFLSSFGCIDQVFVITLYFFPDIFVGERFLLLYKSSILING